LKSCLLLQPTNGKKSAGKHSRPKIFIHDHALRKVIYRYVVGTEKLLIASLTKEAVKDRGVNQSTAQQEEPKTVSIY
jgi:hypothetical protein